MRFMHSTQTGDLILSLYLKISERIRDQFHCRQVRVWDLETLECEHVLKQPCSVDALAASEGAVWGGVGREIVVWGRNE
jgi:hypothetical protein